MNYNVTNLLSTLNLKPRELAEIANVTVQTIHNWRRAGMPVPSKYRKDIRKLEVKPVEEIEDKVKELELFPRCQSVKVGTVIVRTLLDTSPQEWGYLQAFKVAGYNDCPYTIRISRMANSTYVTAYYNTIESWVADLAYLAPLVQSEEFKQYRDKQSK